MKERLSIAIFIIFIIILMGVTMVQINNVTTTTVKVKCMVFYLEDIMNCQDLQQLCSNESCTDYFNQRINKSIEGFKLCEDIS